MHSMSSPCEFKKIHTELKGLPLTTWHTTAAKEIYHIFITLTPLIYILKLMFLGYFSSCRIDIIKYVIYGIASAFFVYGILLMVEGFFTSGAIKDLYGDFKITTCGRCVSAWVSII